MRSASECASSSSSTCTTRCRTIAPWSRCSSTKCTVQTGHLHTVVEGLLLCIEPWERRQQRGMDIKNPIRKRGHKLRRKQPHITGQANQVHVVRLQPSHHIRVVFGPLAALRHKHRRRQPQLARGLQSRRLGDVRNHRRYLDALQPPCANRLRNRNKIRPSPREQNAQPRQTCGLAHVYCTR